MKERSLTLTERTKTMSKQELRELLQTSDKTCDDYDLYALLECETEDDFENELFSAIECIKFDMYYLDRLVDTLKGLTLEDVKGDNE